jgi:hypothetical protein
MIQNIDLSSYRNAWLIAKPFPHIVLDDFVETDAALNEEFPDIHWSN